ncbi:MAG: Rpn family recombination-promoting nuclease/putative transposase [Leptolyngbya sp. IPPAS B-1204]|nr:MAG: DUF4351 domain-containing protein [Leptolyngbya sp. IPPAS B-1204]
MPFDNVCKTLAEQYPVNFVRWLLGAEAGISDPVQVLKTELSLEPIRADAVTFLRLSSRILHLEFQTTPESEPPLPFRMLDYWVRLYRQHRCAITQIVLFLKPTESEAVQVERFEAENTLHRYRVIRLWEQDPTPLLADQALLPLAVLARTDSPAKLLQQVANQVNRIEDTGQQRNLSAYTQLLAGLRFEKEIIQQVFRGTFMRESVIYQEIYQEGRQEGRQEGERSIILRVLTRRFGTVPPELQAQIQALSLPQLEALGEALLDFATLADLTTWLQTHQTI